MVLRGQGEIRHPNTARSPDFDEISPQIKRFGAVLERDPKRLAWVERWSTRPINGLTQFSGRTKDVDLEGIGLGITNLCAVRVTEPGDAPVRAIKDLGTAGSEFPK